ncbi:lipopolysaccharide biosynthesis protein [Bacteroidales bacterium SW299]|nr:lipopolysaccharide biosynthesis protein [Bacteroidales bacterium SW299]
MKEPILDNRRIAKNTVMLYFRMFLVMGVSLFTSREVLRILGVEDLGVYNIVGGIIVLFSFLNNAMVSATQRFLNFELGRNNQEQASRVFSMSVNVHALIALAVLVGGETIGLWFFNTYLNIPIDRRYAAGWVYQFSILAAVVNIMRAPYNACIITYERMSSFAYISIIEVILKLLIVYLLLLSVIDKLILYACLTCLVSVVISLCFYLVCLKRFSISHYKWFWDKLLFKRFLNFSGWSLFGNIANLGAFQGVSIIQNIFCGVLINAAMGIANQVNGAIYSFVSNFQLAFNPQIVKSYAACRWDYCTGLIFKTSRYSFLLLLLIAVPIVTYCDEVLAFWLDSVPEHSVSFCKLIIYSSLIDCIAAPLWMGVYASGQIEKYQIGVGFILLLNIPFSYLVLLWGFSAEATIVVRIVLNVVLFFFRLFYLKSVMKFSIRSYMKQVLLPCFSVCILILVLVGLWIYCGKHYTINLYLQLLISFIVSAWAIYAIGIHSYEKKIVRQFVVDKLLKS